MTDSIPITKPYFTEKEKKLVQKPLESGWVVQGQYVEQFETKMTSFAGANHAIASTSCTTALHLAVRSLDLEPGDEVIVPAFTWVSTANVVEYEKAIPVFCDINLDTFNMDPALIEKSISEDTVGIIPVHLFGLSANMGPILELADQHNLWVIEDAACGLGAYYDNHHVGTFGDAGCFSFHPRKSITTGEGGMVTTNRDDVDSLSRSLRDHGATRSDKERHENEEGYLLSDYPRLGYNYRMTDLQAAVGCAQMEKVEFILEQRKQQARRYDELLANLNWLRAPTVPESCEHGYQAYVTFFNPQPADLNHVEELHQKRNDAMKYLEEQNIATRPGTHAVAFQDYYQDKYNHSRTKFPNALLAEKLSLALPMYVGLDQSDQQRVVDNLIKAGEAIL